MIFLRKLRLVHWALVIGQCLFALDCLAQTDAPRTPAKLRFVFVDEAAGSYSLKIGREFKKLSSSPYSLSPVITPPGFGQLEIHKTLPTIDPETGENIRIKLTTFTPPANTTAALAIVTPRFPGNDPTLTPTASIEFIDNDPSAYPAGTIRVLNRSQHAMAAQFGEDKILVEPSGVQIIRPTTNDRGLVRSRIAGQTATGWKIIDDNVAVVKPETRLTGLFLFSPSGMRFRFNAAFIAERGEPPPSHVWLTYTDAP
ncbi:MAG: hypothetical protein ABII82_17745 [Verrucomicrobiota bacterium]